MSTITLKRGNERMTVHANNIAHYLSNGWQREDAPVSNPGGFVAPDESHSAVDADSLGANPDSPGANVVKHKPGKRKSTKD